MAAHGDSNTNNAAVGQEAGALEALVQLTRSLHEGVRYLFMISWFVSHFRSFSSSIKYLLNTFAVSLFLFVNDTMFFVSFFISLRISDPYLGVGGWCVFWNHLNMECMFIYAKIIKEPLQACDHHLCLTNTRNTGLLF